MKDLVSIIVPVYKAEKYIDDCIKSLVSQTYSNIEIILVDDGSPDNSRLKCYNWRQKDNRIILVTQNNLGVSSARNCGIEYASGKWIIFVDADDVIVPDLVERLVQVSFEKAINTVVCEYKMFKGDKIPKENKECFKGTSIIPTAEIKKLRKGYFCWGILFDKEIVDTNHIRFAPELCNLEDVYFVSIYCSFIKNAAYVDGKGYWYRITQNSITGNCVNIEWQIESWNKLLRAYNNYASNNSLSVNQYKKILFMRRHCINNIWAECLNGNFPYRKIRELNHKFEALPYRKKLGILGSILYTGEYVHKKCFFLEFIFYNIALKIR